MFQTIFIGISLLSNIFITSPAGVSNTHLLGARSFSLENRYQDKWVSDVFKDNILLNMAYLRGYEKTSNVKWDAVEKPFHYDMTLKPGEVFAFHEDVLPQFAGKVAKTTNAHFNSYEGFKSDGWLVGDGVCHLASLINWAARDAGLDVVSPTRHDFAAIPEVPKEYGVAIYNYPGMGYTNQVQNLYITNNRSNDVIFEFDYNGKDLKVTVVEQK
ncbi:MAG TPA: VanW family protein [Patescibacteria group bacterium]|nr:VanW family protein [Patescibacteria group bacterium]